MEVSPLPVTESLKQVSGQVFGTLVKTPLRTSESHIGMTKFKSQIYFQLLFLLMHTQGDS